MASKLGKSKDRLTRPKKKFTATQNSSRNQSYLGMNGSKHKESMLGSRSFLNFSENFNSSMNESFHPSINNKSREIDRKNSKSPAGSDRFDRLYNHKDQKEAKLRALKDQYLKSEILKEIENCSFRPIINETLNQKPRHDIYTRHHSWLQSKQQKIMQLKCQQDQAESDLCTFKPNIKSENGQRGPRVFSFSNCVQECSEEGYDTQGTVDEGHAELIKQIQILDQVVKETERQVTEEEYEYGHHKASMRSSWFSGINPVHEPSDNPSASRSSSSVASSTANYDQAMIELDQVLRSSEFIDL